MKFCYLGPQAISRVDFWCFITAMSMRNRTMGILALEDGLLVVILVIFDYLYIEIVGARYRSVDRESNSYELTLVLTNKISALHENNDRKDNS